MAAKKHLESVFRAIREISEVHGVAKREEIRLSTGLAQSIVDECIKDLREDFGKIERLRAGVFVPNPTFPEYPATQTQLDDGRVKLEWGDETMIITPNAARAFARMLAGYVTLNGR